MTVCCEPSPYPIDEWLEPIVPPGLRPLGSLRAVDCLLDVLEGVVASKSGTWLLVRIPEERSDLFPARRRVRLGEASARASFRNVGSALKEARDVMS